MKKLKKDLNDEKFDETECSQEPLDVYNKTIKDSLSPNATKTYSDIFNNLIDTNNNNHITFDHAYAMLTGYWDKYPTG